MKVLTVLGTRPQIIKSAPLSLAFKQAGIKEVMVHTGQHYDAAMSDVFFEQLGISAPAYNLQVGSGSPGYQLGEGMKRLEPVLLEETPDIVLVFGDTFATLLGATLAAHHHISLAHVEAGLRSYNRLMPEEINRVVTDHLSTWCFAPTLVAVENLAKEGIIQGVHQVGDIMLDAVKLSLEKAEALYPQLLSQWRLKTKEYYLLTMHRAETTAEPEKVNALLTTLDGLKVPVLFPVHPRVRPLVEPLTSTLINIQLVSPLSYLEMLVVEKNARLIITDSGGVQKEAAFLQVPCVTLRSETEWVETVSSGWNFLAGLSPGEVLQGVAQMESLSVEGLKSIHHFYGDGNSRSQIVALLKKEVSGKELQLALN